MDLSFLIEVVEPTEVQTQKIATLADLVADEHVPYRKPLGTIKISALKREDFADRPEILSKYFRNNNRDLDRFHIPELTAEQHTAILKDVKFTEKTIKNKSLETASDYYIRKARLMAVAKDLNCTFRQLDIKDYIWDERYYILYHFMDNVRLVDDWYRDYDKEDRYAITARDVYIKEDPRTAVLDTEMFDELYSFCINTIRQRKAMLFSKVDKCLGCLRNIIEYTQGFVENPTRQQMATMRKYRDFFQEMLDNEEVMEFVKTNNDMTLFGADELTHSDYVQTYKTLVKSLVSGTDADLQELVDILNGVDDPYLNEILEEIPEISFRAWELDTGDDM